MNDFIEIKATKQSLAQRKKVYGKGINNASYLTGTVQGGRRRKCPYYTKWSSMLQPCYDDKFKEMSPTYIGATVCEEWLTFSNFKAWMEKQEWEGLELDKDIIKPGNKQYSPDACCLVPQSLNALLTDHRAARGDTAKELRDLDRPVVIAAD